MAPSKKIRVLVADDEVAIRILIEEELDKKRFKVRTAKDGEQALDMLKAAQYDVAVLDLKMPRLDGLEVFRRLIVEEFAPEVITLTGHGDIQTAVEAMRMGAFDFMTKPVGIDKLEMSIVRAYDKRKMKRENLSLRYELDRVADSSQKFITQDDDMIELLKVAGKIALHDTTVLIEGESGTGKELIAKHVHDCSLRKDSSFIAFNCAALPETLIESELFGYYKGAFTGADRGKPGLFELADHGTLFFDEIGELSPTAQSKLLRVIETGSFYRLGGTSEVTVDVRIIAATNRDLKSMCQEGLFREDLYYRLNVMNLKLKPLRKRINDVPLLATHFLQRNEFEHLHFSEDAHKLMMAHKWPGNVRELEHAIMRASILTEGDTILPSVLPPQIAGHQPGDEQTASEALEHHTLSYLPRPLEDVEREQIMAAMKHFSGHQGKAADALNISTRTLYRKLKEYEKQSGEGTLR
jgi:DNA-binding NtrC family response regulator